MGLIIVKGGKILFKQLIVSLIFYVKLLNIGKK